MAVKLTNLLEGIFLQKKWNKTFLNLKSGDIVVVLNKYYESTDEIDLESLSDSTERRQAIIAGRVKDSDNHIPLPVITEDQTNRTLISFVTELIGTTPDPGLSNSELEQLIRDHGKMETWYSYNLASIKKLLLDWAFENKIEVKNL